MTTEETTPAPITYGDTFTLPSLTHADTGEPVRLFVGDVRTVENAGEMYEDRAAFTPVDADGHRVSTLETLAIGRTRREFGALSRMGARWAHNRLEVSGHSVGLTPKMNAAVSADLDALTFDLPGYTVEELRTQLVVEAGRYGESLGRLTGHGSRAPWDNYQQDESARALRGEAMDADTRRRMHEAIVEAFAAQSAERLRVSAR